MRFSLGSPLVGALFLSALLSSGLASTPPSCSYDDRPTPSAETDEWRFALVDTSYRVPADFMPSDLVSLRLAGFDDDRTLRKAAVDDLRELLRTAEAEGLNYELQSAFRSYGYQEQVFEGWVRSLGRERALSTSARPGHSEHQLGTAVDLRSAGGPAPWDMADWARTEEGAWLKENAWRFGFVMSYPAGRKNLTCYAYEPWHYRWIGRPEAASVRSSGQTLREWLWRRAERKGDQ